MEPTIEEWVDRHVKLNISNLFAMIDINTLDEEDKDTWFYLDNSSEQWVVSEYLGKKLESKGEPIARNFAGHSIWGRKIQGQAIYMDSVINKIYQEN